MSIIKKAINMAIEFLRRTCLREAPAAAAEAASVQETKAEAAKKASAAKKAAKAAQKPAMATLGDDDFVAGDIIETVIGLDADVARELRTEVYCLACGESAVIHFRDKDGVQYAMLHNDSRMPKRHHVFVGDARDIGDDRGVITCRCDDFCRVVRPEVGVEAQNILGLKGTVVAYVNDDLHLLWCKKHGWYVAEAISKLWMEAMLEDFATSVAAWLGNNIGAKAPRKEGTMKRSRKIDAATLSGIKRYNAATAAAEKAKLAGKKPVASGWAPAESEADYGFDAGFFFGSPTAMASRREAINAIADAKAFAWHRKAAEERQIRQALTKKVGLVPNYFFAGVVGDDACGYEHREVRNDLEMFIKAASEGNFAAARAAWNNLAAAASQRSGGLDLVRDQRFVELKKGFAAALKAYDAGKTATTLKFCDGIKIPEVRRIFRDWALGATATKVARADFDRAREQAVVNLKVELSKLGPEAKAEFICRLNELCELSHKDYAEIVEGSASLSEELASAMRSAAFIGIIRRYDEYSKGLEWHICSLKAAYARSLAQFGADCMRLYGAMKINESGFAKSLIRYQSARISDKDKAVMALVLNGDSGFEALQGWINSSDRLAWIVGALKNRLEDAKGQTWFPKVELETAKVVAFCETKAGAAKADSEEAEASQFFLDEDLADFQAINQAAREREIAKAAAWTDLLDNEEILKNVSEGNTLRNILRDFQESEQDAWKAEQEAKKADQFWYYDARTQAERDLQRAEEAINAYEPDVWYYANGRARYFGIFDDKVAEEARRDFGFTVSETARTIWRVIGLFTYGYRLNAVWDKVCAEAKAAGLKPMGLKPYLATFAGINYDALCDMEECAAALGNDFSSRNLSKLIDIVVHMGGYNEHCSGSRSDYFQAVAYAASCLTEADVNAVVDDKFVQMYEAHWASTFGEKGVQAKVSKELARGIVDGLAFGHGELGARNDERISTAEIYADRRESDKVSYEPAHLLTRGQWLEAEAKKRFHDLFGKKLKPEYALDIRAGKGNRKLLAALDLDDNVELEQLYAAVKGIEVVSDEEAFRRWIASSKVAFAAKKSEIVRSYWEAVRSARSGNEAAELKKLAIEQLKEFDTTPVVEPEDAPAGSSILAELAKLDIAEAFVPALTAEEKAERYDTASRVEGLLGDLGLDGFDSAIAEAKANRGAELLF